jgi:uncharacterized membrane protein
MTTTDAARTNGKGAPIDASIDSDHEYAVMLAAFDDDDAVRTASSSLSEVGTQGAEIRDVVTLRTDACGVVHIRQLNDYSTAMGIAAGMLGGLTASLLLSRPPAMPMVGMGMVGAMLGRLRYEYRKAGTGAALLGTVRPNTSALLAIVKAEDISRAAAALPANTTLRTTYVDGRAASHLAQVARRIG